MVLKISEEGSHPMMDILVVKFFKYCKNGRVPKKCDAN